MHVEEDLASIDETLVLLILAWELLITIDDQIVPK